MDNWKETSSNVRRSELYNINLNIFYGDENDFNKLINKKISDRHKELEKERRENDKINYVDAKLEYESKK